MSRIRKKADIKQVSSENLLYLAGFMDGEGTFSIHSYRKTGKRKRGIEYRPFICVSNTNKEIIDWVATLLGVGSVWQFRRQEKNKNWKSAYKYTLYGSNAVALANLLVPYLKIKKLQAEILIEYGKTLIDANMPYRVPSNILVLRNKFKNDIQTLNKVGIS